MTTKFGIEIEFKGLGRNPTYVATLLQRQAEVMGFDFNVVGERYNHALRNYWKVVTDASVYDGCELVSPPLPMTEESFTLVRKVFEALRTAGATIDRQCGTHVHLDASFLDNLQHHDRTKFFHTVVECFKVAEPKFDALVKAHRNNNNYCKSLRGEQACRIIGDRYHKVNLENAYDRHQTVEFRQLQGTLNGDAVVAWVQICKVFTENTWKFFQARQVAAQAQIQANREAALAHGQNLRGTVAPF